MVNFDEIISRAKKHLGMTADKEFAKVLGLSASDLSKRKKIGSLLPLLIEWGVNQKVNLDWLLRGEEEPFKKESSAYLDHPEQPIGMVNECQAQFATHAPNNVIELEHKDLITRFKDKSRAKMANMKLLEIESLDHETFIEVVGYIKGVANGLRAQRPDRRQVDRRATDTPDHMPGGGERRSGTDRRAK